MVLRGGTPAARAAPGSWRKEKKIPSLAGPFSLLPPTCLPRAEDSKSQKTQKPRRAACRGEPPGPGGEGETRSAGTLEGPRAVADKLPSQQAHFYKSPLPGPPWWRGVENPFASAGDTDSNSATTGDRGLNSKPAP